MKNENTKVKATEAEAVSQGKQVNGVITGEEVMASHERQQNEKKSLPDEVDEVNVSESEFDELDEEFDDELEEEEDIPEVRLELQRERFVGKDKTGKKKRFWTYFVTGKVYGKEVRSNFEAGDKGGYELMSMLFDFGTEVKVTYSEERMTDSKTGAVSSYSVFYACSVAPDGNVVEYKVKPMRASDKSIFMMLYNAKKAEILKTIKDGN